ncbi:hypothetical protein [Oryzisolibacter propanilivorax]|nr:hypothetical protein [Oryzisolibacter propanilivorax]
MNADDVAQVAASASGFGADTGAIQAEMLYDTRSVSWARRRLWSLHY